MHVKLDLRFVVGRLGSILVFYLVCNVLFWGTLCLRHTDDHRPVSIVWLDTFPVVMSTAILKNNLVVWNDNWGRLSCSIVCIRIVQTQKSMSSSFFTLGKHLWCGHPLSCRKMSMVFRYFKSCQETMGIANTVSAMSFCGFVSQPNDWESSSQCEV